MSKSTETIRTWRAGEFGKLDGSRAKVSAQITSQTEIPEHWRTAIIAAIAEKPAAHNWITLDAHSNSTASNETVHLHIESSQENI